MFPPKRLIFFSPKVLTYQPLLPTYFFWTEHVALRPSNNISFILHVFRRPLHVWLIISCHGIPEISKSFLHIPFCFTHFLFPTSMYHVHCICTFLFATTVAYLCYVRPAPPCHAPPRTPVRCLRPRRRKVATDLDHSDSRPWPLPELHAPGRRLAGCRRCRSLSPHLAGRRRCRRSLSSSRDPSRHATDRRTATGITSHQDRCNLVASSSRPLPSSFLLW